MRTTISHVSKYVFEKKMHLWFHVDTRNILVKEY